MYSDFQDYKPVNLGFGGSTLAACTWFFDRIVAPIDSARRIVVYAGDNDLGDGRHPAEVCLYYCQLIGQIRHRFGDTPCFFNSIKPCLQRWEIISQIKNTNKLICEEIQMDTFQFYVDIFPSILDERGTPLKDLFEPDGLHLNPLGYSIWKSKVREVLTTTGNT